MIPINDVGMGKNLAIQPGDQEKPPGRGDGGCRYACRDTDKKINN